jgi:hypothetical protein
LQEANSLLLQLLLVEVENTVFLALEVVVTLALFAEVVLCLIDSTSSAHGVVLASCANSRNDSSGTVVVSQVVLERSGSQCTVYIVPFVQTYRRIALVVARLEHMQFTVTATVFSFTVSFLTTWAPSQLT